jgi:hypothetical protein
MAEHMYTLDKDDDYQQLLPRFQQETASPILPSHPLTTTTSTILNFDIDKCTTVMKFKKMTLDLPWNVKTDRMQVEPKKMFHIDSSSSTSDSTDCSITAMKTKINEIPNFLTTQRRFFQQLFHEIQSSVTETIPNTDMEDLSEIPRLIYKIRIIQTYHLLWTAYYKSGKGELDSRLQTDAFFPLNSCIWPKQIKTMLPLKNIDQVEKNRIYHNFTCKHLSKLDSQLKEYQHKLNLKVNNYPYYSFTIQNRIESYIEQNIKFFRSTIEHRTELVYYDYCIRALKLKYFQQNPNTYQVNFVTEKSFISLTYFLDSNAEKHLLYEICTRIHRTRISFNGTTNCIL